MTARLILPWARAYAAHAGLDIPEGALRREIERRLGLMVWWAPFVMALAAVAARWLLPLWLLGEAKPFEALGEEGRERMLQGLQETRSLLLRGLFFALKSLVLACCYGRQEYLARIGYRMSAP